MATGLTYLEHYEYECTEQTVSRFLPNVLSLKALQEAGLSNPDLEQNLRNVVSQGLQKLYNQQHADGGWGWWSENKSDLQVSSYAVLGMVEAQNAGYDVSQQALANGKRFVTRNLVMVKETDTSTKLNRQAFALYVLARAGEGSASHAGRLYERRQTLSNFGRAFLAQTLYMIDPSDPRLSTLVSDLVSSAGLSATGAHWNEEWRDYWNWDSNTRSTAIVLDALIHLDPSNPINENAVRWLMSNRTEGRWASTQETAWALIALTDWIKTTGELSASYEWAVAMNDQQIAGGTAGPDTLLTPQIMDVAVSSLNPTDLNRLTLARGEGGGALYYTAHLNIFLPVQEVEPLSRGITVSRQYFHLGDLENAVTETPQGEVLMARVTVVVPNDVHYLVVEDPLPAGLEAIDESLKTSQTVFPGGEPNNPNLQWQYGRTMDGWGWWNFNHVELRDEKVVLSADYLPAGTYEYTYRVRAATPGTYRVIPATGYEFYFPEVYGRSEGMLFNVLPPQ
jgi:uncharacterized protein YfaS (alpha-2-macroglobulin family)